MELIKKVGEITCKNGNFANWIEENLKNTEFIVQVRTTGLLDTVIEIYEKIE